MSVQTNISVQKQQSRNNVNACFQRVSLRCMCVPRINTLILTLWEPDIISASSDRRRTHKHGPVLQCQASFANEEVCMKKGARMERKILYTTLNLYFRISLRMLPFCILDVIGLLAECSYRTFLSFCISDVVGLLAECSYFGLFAECMPCIYCMTCILQTVRGHPKKYNGTH